MAALDELKLLVQQKFTDIRAALHMREKLLLRQLEVIAQQQMGTKCEAEVQFQTEQEDELLAAIRSFGRFQLDNMNLALQDIYLKNEDYITPANDHETMYKCLQQVSVLDDEDEEQPEAIVVDFSKNKSLIEHNRKNVNDSIINITLQEAKELIRKAKAKRDLPIPPLNLEELDDELESSIAEAVSSLGGRDSPVNTKSSQTCLDAVSKKSKKSRFKPKITINNCNGTINLRNIASLTINCANEEGVSAEIPLQRQSSNSAQEEASDAASQSSKSTQKSKRSSLTLKHVATPTNQPAMAVTVETSSTGTSTPTTTTTSSSNYSSNCSSRSQSKKQKANKKAQGKNSYQGASQSSSGNAYAYDIVDDNDDDEENNAVTCDFYNRLLNEIKHSLKEKSKRSTLPESIWLDGNAAAVREADSTCTDVTGSNTASVSTATAQPGKRLILKNFENLKIILEANGDEESFHPVQIEQWLAEIISEADLEPMQNTDILEHSKIHNESV